MNILVPLKQVPDTGLNLRAIDGKLEESAIKRVISPYDEFALEESLKLKEKTGGRLFVLSLGPAAVKEALMSALALGADEAFHLIAVKTPQDPLETAHILKRKILEIPDLSLIFCGKLSVDSNNFAVPQMLAALLSLPFVSNVSRLELKEGEFILSREREGGGFEILKARPPVLLSADKGLNQPRCPSLPGIMKAKKKPFREERAEQPAGRRIRLKSLSPPPEKNPPYMIQGKAKEQVAELLKILREKEKVL